MKEGNMHLEQRKMSDIVIPKTLKDIYKRMANRAKDLVKIVKVTKKGFETLDGEIETDQYLAAIEDSKDHYYRWNETDEGLKIEKRDIEEFENREAAKKEDFDLGADLTFKVVKPDEFKGEMRKISLATMSTEEFDRYVKRLARKGFTPNHVYTRIYYQIVPTKKGGPKPKAMFQDLGPIEPEPIDVTPVEDLESSKVHEAWKNV
jgi:hypothetical protein